MKNNAHMSPQTPNILHKIVFLIISLAMALASVCAYSQIRIDWQQCYGSMSNDWATRIVKKAQWLLDSRTCYSTKWHGDNSRVKPFVGHWN
jgi:hypothetical protein